MNQPWPQNCDPLGSTFLSTLAAAAPVCILFYLLAVRRTAAWLAAVYALAASALVALAVYRMPPVMAAGAGTVAFMGVQSGYGNFVLLNHGNGYSTAYGHLSRFAPGLRRGSRVRQGQVVAFSGMTGMATGPHLHYEIRVNNVQVNPTTVKIAQGRVLQGAQLREFQSARLQTDALIVGTPLETRLADASSELRQAKAK